MPPTTPLSQVITLWVHKAFASLRKTIRSNLALFLSTLLAAPLDPTLSDLARRTPLPTLGQSRLNRLWRFLHHSTLQNPWALTEALLLLVP
ncbi:IS4 family transposase, partial [Acinetobacter baumannii]